MLGFALPLLYFTILLFPSRLTHFSCFLFLLRLSCFLDSLLLMKMELALWFCIGSTRRKSIRIRTVHRHSSIHMVWLRNVHPPIESRASRRRVLISTLALNVISSIIKNFPSECSTYFKGPFLSKIFKINVKFI